MHSYAHSSIHMCTHARMPTHVPMHPSSWFLGNPSRRSNTKWRRLSSAHLLGLSYKRRCVNSYRRHLLPVLALYWKPPSQLSKEYFLPSPTQCYQVPSKFPSVSHFPEPCGGWSLVFTGTNKDNVFPPGPLLCSAVTSLPLAQPVVVLAYKPGSQRPGPSHLSLQFLTPRADFVTHGREKKQW